MSAHAVGVVWHLEVRFDTYFASVNLVTSTSRSDEMFVSDGAVAEVGVQWSWTRNAEHSADQSWALVSPGVHCKRLPYCPSLLGAHDGFHCATVTVACHSDKNAAGPLRVLERAVKGATHLELTLEASEFSEPAVLQAGGDLHLMCLA